MSGNLRPSKSLPQNNPNVCIEKRTAYSRRSSVDPYSTDVSSKHATAQQPGKARHSMPALPSNPSTSNLSSSEANWEHSAQESSRLLFTSTSCSSNPNVVSLDPPVTQEVLRELDTLRLEHDLNFRHDLNFDPEIEFRVNTQGPQRRERECEYWHALATEIALLLAHYQRNADGHSSHPLCISLPSQGVQTFPQSGPLRLPRLFGALQNILKHLLPSEQWPIIDAALDVRLLMQQLEHGICDLIALSEWLSKYLRRFCSPTRDCLLDKITSAIRSGVENAKTERILHGLITTFEVLYLMNLVS